MTRKTTTAAIARYARRHGHYARTVRNMTTLRTCAVNEWQQPGTRWVVGRDGAGNPTLPINAADCDHVHAIAISGAQVCTVCEVVTA